MSYADPSDVFRRYPPISTIVGSDAAGMMVSTLDVGSIYIADAEGYVNAFLRGRYVTPMAREPILTQVTVDISIYRMIEDHAPRIPDMAEKRMIAANSLLWMLQSGVMQLDPASQVLVTTGGDQEVWSTALEQVGPVFGTAEDRLNRYRFDTCSYSNVCTY